MPCGREADACDPSVGAAQEREAVVYLQSLVLREARKSVRAHAAADDGALRAADRRVDDTARRFNSADGDSAVLAPQIA